MRQRDIRIQTVTDHRQLFRPETRLLQNEIKGVAGRLPKNSGTAPVDASITLGQGTAVRHPAAVFHRTVPIRVDTVKRGAGPTASHAAQIAS